MQVAQIGVEHVTLKLETHALAFTGDFDETGIFELFNVMREGGRGDWLALAEVGAKNATALRADMLQDLVTARVGKGFGYQAELARGEPDGFCLDIFLLASDSHFEMSY